MDAQYALQWFVKIHGVYQQRQLTVALLSLQRLTRARKEKGIYNSNSLKSQYRRTDNIKPSNLMYVTGGIKDV